MQNHEQLMEPDPKKWWKEHQRQEINAPNKWEGIQGLTPKTIHVPNKPPEPRGMSLRRFMHGFIVRLILAVILFGICWGWINFKLPGSEHINAWVLDVVTQDMDFVAIDAWYGERFGDSLSLLPFQRKSANTKQVSSSLKLTDAVVPVIGKVVQSFKQNGNGVKVAAMAGSTVSAVSAGKVLQLEVNQLGGTTILIQHPNRMLSVYGNLEAVVVKVNSWVEAGDPLGQLQATNDTADRAILYFAIEQNGQSINPVELVPFD
ncbi:MAG: peptidoglycan DD-metalloendopeptidase family protein [Candidatus Cohnella colombiensis]|uniref:Peptidoglycan DD-metalloendopeptidase family protein n=1 Tax=Candidatus Cohnella colombiensis TaxID=3121368 RepID=A0AA95JGU7_9BACL|nr:MAG: peptidoglycan DD-metalloendopeptidase family protein [Cohnella sp.]